MAGHAFLRVLKPSGSRHELQVSECFIHHYGFVASEERFLMLGEKKVSPTPRHPTELTPYLYGTFVRVKRAKA
jgi:hypothetical protein